MSKVTSEKAITILYLFILMIIVTSWLSLVIKSVNRRDEGKRVAIEVEKIIPVPTIYREDLLNNCIKHIKKYESLGKTRYWDNDSSITIGYGHHILKGEHFANIITEDEADKLLREDFNNYIEYAKKYTDVYNEQLALGMFLYNFGETKFKGSTLRKLIEDQKPIDNEIVKWKHFRYNGKKRSNRGLLERRRFELSIYNLNK
jgi:lysozyme